MFSFFTTVFHRLGMLLDNVKYLRKSLSGKSKVSFNHSNVYNLLVVSLYISLKYFIPFWYQYKYINVFPSALM